MSTIPSHLAVSWEAITKGVNPSIAKSWRDRLVSLYGQPWRHYHTLEHISELVAICKQNEEAVKNTLAVHYAIWFHDAIYQPLRGDNEEKSALLWEEFGKEAGLETDLISLVSAYIIATKSHQVPPQLSDDSDLLYFLDFDLAVLAWEEEKYDLYASQIRKEYCQYPLAAFVKGRISVLSQLMEVGLFHSPLKSTLNEKALSNLNREQDALKKQVVSVEPSTCKIGYVQLPIEGSPESHFDHLKWVATHTTKRLYIDLQFPGSTWDPSLALSYLPIVSDLYEALARFNLDLDVRILFPTSNQVLQDPAVLIDGLWGTESIGSSYNTIREKASLQKITVLPLQPFLHDGLPELNVHQTPFAHGAVGGTFDHLHAGHKVLLTFSALLSNESLVIGISDGPLLAKKKFKEMMQTYEERVQQVKYFLHDIKPSLLVRPFRLLDVYGPTITVPELNVLFVSDETAGGVDSVNAEREKVGYSQLEGVVVTLVGHSGDEQAESSGQKLSSTALRQRAFEASKSPAEETGKS